MKAWERLLFKESLSFNVPSPSLPARDGVKARAWPLDSKSASLSVASDSGCMSPE